ncbi:hypothetical protein JX265_000315 [Neoarthrinium moseri]|uniref:Protein kinase domain-containing protein n=1 Tax=Neoarthrinium moseri TaxID=1658444 RepID=A0A9P9WYI8_9PEZI|nr:hypothetical protein JX265_000315 [Neoarthrinium moseri]
MDTSGDLYEQQENEFQVSPDFRRPLLDTPTSWRDQPTHVRNIPSATPWPLPALALSEAEQSSTCQDRGDSGHLENTIQLLATETTIQPRPDLLAEVGSGMRNSDSRQDLADSEDDSSTNSLQGIQDALHAATLDHPSNNGTRFIPIDDFDRLMTRENVRESCKSLTVEGSLETLVADIWDPHSYNNIHGQRLSTSRRKLFAILIALGKAQKIKSFIKCAIWDKDLPVQQNKYGGQWVCHQDGNDKGDLIYLDFMKKWRLPEQRWFDTYQWWMLSPIFDGLNGKVLFYPLHNQIVLPFIQEEENEYDFQNGGFGEVRRVKIHPAHHNLSSSSARDQRLTTSTINMEFETAKNPSFAIKRLFSSSNSKSTFKREVEALKRFSSGECKFLIKLLATYEHGGYYHLVFPWADGNLQELWQRNPNPEHSYNSIRWLATQCWGVAEALRRIHDNLFDEGANSGQSATRGRHGDIKPENILYFVDSAATDHDLTQIQLKISDFGLARWHTEKSNQPIYENGTQRDATYRAPEHDLTKSISQPADIWPLACLFFEFLTWYLRGWEGVEKQTDARVDESNALFVKEDNYFNNKQANGESKLGVILKECVVKWFDELHHDLRCTQFIADFLELISDRMMRIRIESRAECTEIVQALEGMKDNANAKKYGLRSPE